MVTNVEARRIPPALALLLWCALGTALVQLVLWRVAPNPRDFSPIFWFLLRAFDTHGNLLLFAIAVVAFLLRRHAGVEAVLRIAAEHPWKIAAGALPLLCLGSVTVYQSYPLSMDEYVAWFQAHTFAAGRIDGQFPPELMNELMPRFPSGYFFVASRPTGVITGSYWPGFALLATPFAWAGIPWAANPVISVLTLPAVHRLTLTITGSREAAGWALLLTLASPVFVVSAMSFYAMPAHLLLNVVYALLLLQPTPLRALLAGLVGSLALTLHNPAPHLFFSIAFIVWLSLRRGSMLVLPALFAGYLPLLVVLGWGWQQHLAEIVIAKPAAAVAQAQASTPGPASRVASAASAALVPPSLKILEARVAGLSKAWTWGSAALLVLAAWGFAAARERVEIKLLTAALAITFFGYFLVPFDQGHGWGYRYLHSAWFVLPVLGGLGMTRLADAETRHMAGWAIVLSLLFANGLRLMQVDSFIDRHLNLVPPLARPADPARPEIVFIDSRAGSYVRDMLHNDPLLRGPRITMAYDGPQKSAEVMARRFPDYTKRAEGKWGELWSK